MNSGDTRRKAGAIRGHLKSSNVPAVWSVIGEENYSMLADGPALATAGQCIFLLEEAESSCSLTNNSRFSSDILIRMTVVRSRNLVY